MPENKKFLDSAGTSHLWSKIIDELNKKGQVDTVTATNDSIVITGSASAPSIAVKISPKAGNSLQVLSTTGEEGLYINAPASDIYSMTKATTATTGYSATYYLTKNGTQEGAEINIPKDMVVSSGMVKTVTTANNPYAGAAVGDSYIELTLANTDDDKLYIPANSLVEYVTSGSATNDMVIISVNNNHQVTASITDGSITTTKLHTDIQTALNRAASAVQASDFSSGTTPGAFLVQGNAVSIYGLGSAAYSSTSDFDAAGTAIGVYQVIIPLSTTEIDAAIQGTSSNS